MAKRKSNPKPNTEIDMVKFNRNQGYIIALILILLIVLLITFVNVQKIQEETAAGEYHGLGPNYCTDTDGTYRGTVPYGKDYYQKGTVTKPTGEIAGTDHCEGTWTVEEWYCETRMKANYMYHNCNTEAGYYLECSDGKCVYTTPGP